MLSTTNQNGESIDFICSAVATLMGLFMLRPLIRTWLGVPDMPAFIDVERHTHLHYDHNEHYHFYFSAPLNEEEEEDNADESSSSSDSQDRPKTQESDSDAEDGTISEENSSEDTVGSWGSL
jgi:hypothetical protein